MGLDDFKNDPSSELKDSSEDNDISKYRDKNTDTDIDVQENNHPSNKKDFTSEYKKSYIKECWMCGSKKYKIRSLKELHSVWFCSNEHCSHSIVKQFNDVSLDGKKVSNIEPEKAQNIIQSKQSDTQNMGLDEFTGGSSNSSNNTSSDNKSSSNQQDTTRQRGAKDDLSELDSTDLTFYGSQNPDLGVTPMQRKGAMSNYSVSSILQRTNGVIEIDTDHVKYYLPMFTIITSNNEYNQGDIYELKHTKSEPKASWNAKPVVCMGVTETQLSNINKELAMFEAGSCSKKRVMDKFDEQLDKETTSNTDIQINFFGDMFNIRDLAQANEEFRNGQLIDRDAIESKVLRRKMLSVKLDK